MNTYEYMDRAVRDAEIAVAAYDRAKKTMRNALDRVKYHEQEFMIGFTRVRRVKVPKFRR
jgi:hypothetical protein